jgi:hypothetical protein
MCHAFCSEYVLGLLVPGATIVAYVEAGTKFYTRNRKRYSWREPTIVRIPRIPRIHMIPPAEP